MALLATKCSFNPRLVTVPIWLSFTDDGLIAGLVGLVFLGAGLTFVGVETYLLVVLLVETVRLTGVGLLVVFLVLVLLLATGAGRGVGFLGAGFGGLGFR